MTSNLSPNEILAANLSLKTLLIVARSSSVEELSAIILQKIRQPEK